MSKPLSEILTEACGRCELTGQEATAVMAAVEWLSKMSAEEAGKSGIGAIWPRYCKSLMEREKS